MIIEKNKVVSIVYELKVKNECSQWELIEKTEESEPMVFLFGSSGLPEKFEKELEGKGVESEFEFSLTSDEAYGDVDLNAIARIPANVFEKDGTVDLAKFQPGDLIPMSDPDGHVVRGRVLQVTPDEVEMDFNHPLAGYDLLFKGIVVDVRDATADEIAHGHAHGPGGHHH